MIPRTRLNNIRYTGHADQPCCFRTPRYFTYVFQSKRRGNPQKEYELFSILNIRNWMRKDSIAQTPMSNNPHNNRGAYCIKYESSLTSLGILSLAPKFE